MTTQGNYILSKLYIHVLVLYSVSSMEAPPMMNKARREQRMEVEKSFPVKNNPKKHLFKWQNVLNRKFSELQETVHCQCGLRVFNDLHDVICVRASHYDMYPSEYQIENFSISL